MAELKTWDGEQWVTLADLDVTPELAALAERGQPLSHAEFMYAVLESARRKPRPLVCRYCGSSLRIEMRIRVGHGQYDEPGLIECTSADCMADWRPDGTPLTDPKGQPIPDA